MVFTETKIPVMDNHKFLLGAPHTYQTQESLKLNCAKALLNPYLLVIHSSLISAVPSAYLAPVVHYIVFLWAICGILMSPYIWAVATAINFWLIFFLLNKMNGRDL